MAAKGAEEEGGTVMVFVELVGVEMVVASMVVLASSKPETLRRGEPWVLRLLLLPLRKILPGDRLLRLRLIEDVDGNMHLLFSLAGGKDGDGVAGWGWVMHQGKIQGKTRRPPMRRANDACDSHAHGRAREKQARLERDNSWSLRYDNKNDPMHQSESSRPPILATK